MIIKYLKQWIKPVGLFLFGVGMIVWGYMANVVDKKEIVKTKQTIPEIFDEKETVRHEEESKRMNESKTVIESENKAEESSATQ